MNRQNNSAGKVLVCCFAVVSLVILVFACLISCKAEAIGNQSGTVLGEAVGVAVGSFQGVTEGLSEGAKAGTAEGLSAKDTQIRLQNALSTKARIEVLAADVNLKNFQEIGEKYAELEIIPGNAIFAVDITKASILWEKTEKAIIITVPQPELALQLDFDNAQVLAEAQKKSWTRSEEDEITGALNTYTALQQEAAEKLEGYDELIQFARTAAERQIRAMAETVNIENNEIVVVFEEGD